MFSLIFLVFIPWYSVFHLIQSTDEAFNWSFYLTYFLLGSVRFEVQCITTGPEVYFSSQTFTLMLRAPSLISCSSLREEN
jgi:hypothetical protein